MKRINNIVIFVTITIALFTFFFLLAFSSFSSQKIEHKDFCTLQNGTYTYDTCYIKEGNHYVPYIVKEINGEEILVRR